MALEPLKNPAGERREGVNSYGTPNVGTQLNPSISPVSAPKIQTPLPTYISPNANADDLKIAGLALEQMHSGRKGMNVACEAYFPPPSIAYFQRSLDPSPGAVQASGVVKTGREKQIGTSTQRSVIAIKV